MNKNKLHLRRYRRALAVNNRRCFNNNNIGDSTFTPVNVSEYWTQYHAYGNEYSTRHVRVLSRNHITCVE